MKTGRAKSAVVKDAQAPKYILDSYEYRLLNWLGSLDEFLKSREIPYAVFGGSAVAGYIGHLPRKLHDIDLIVHPSNSRELLEFLVQNGYELQETHKSSKGEYLKLMRRNHVYEIITSVFPGKFRLLNLDDVELPIVGTYDFTAAIKRASRRVIQSLDGRENVTVSVIPLEDLIISKLWPTFEPNTVHDILLLFNTKEALSLDIVYMRERMESDLNLKLLCYQTFQSFQDIYPRTAWYMLAGDKGYIDKVSALLNDCIFQQ